VLFLLFQLGRDRYALDASRVVEVVPLVTLKGLPQAPRGWAGVFNYRGQPVPAVDLCELTTGRPARECLSTRIIVVRHPGAQGEDQLLGLIAEHATQMMRRDAKDFVASGVRADRAPYLGPMMPDGGGWIQWLHEDRLLSNGTREALSKQLREAGEDFRTRDRRDQEPTEK
jgi:chemotaxis-related protein WspB